MTEAERQEYIRLVGYKPPEEFKDTPQEFKDIFAEFFKKDS